MPESGVLHNVGDCKIISGVLKVPQNFLLSSESVFLSENISLQHPGDWCE